MSFQVLEEVLKRHIASTPPDRSPNNLQNYHDDLCQNIKMHEPEKALMPQGQLIGLQIGANADTLLFLERKELENETQMSSNQDYT